MRSLSHCFTPYNCSAVPSISAENEPIQDGTNIFFRAHLLPAARLSEIPSRISHLQFRTNLRPVAVDRPVYRELLSRFTVWDYSRRNLTAIRSLVDHHDVHLVPSGCMPQLTRIPAAPSEDIDVLFYGSVNQRRHAGLDALEQAGLRVMVELVLKAQRGML